MSRSYSHIQQYEKEILELHKKGLSQKEIGERHGFSKEQVKRFVHRYHDKERKFKAGIAIHKKGRPPKDAIVNRVDKVSELKYIIARKETKIKQLEMENELMRDFLSLTEVLFCAVCTIWGCSFTQVFYYLYSFNFKPESAALVNFT